MNALVLRFQGPMMALGGPAVDNIRPLRPFPAASMLAGLLANALGLDHRDFARIQRLQDRLRFASRVDQPGEFFVDYQTVDLGQPFLAEGWTTRGAPEGRSGGSAKKGTHIRYRHYWADRVVTVALALGNADESPTLTELETALARPARPLFLGRKCCPPSEPVLVGRTEGRTLRDILRELPAHGETEPARWRAQWPEDEGPEPGGACRRVEVYDLRDWANQIHAGSRWVWEGWLVRKENGDG